MAKNLNILPEYTVLAEMPKTVSRDKRYNYELQRAKYLHDTGAISDKQFSDYVAQWGRNNPAYEKIGEFMRDVAMAPALLMGAEALPWGKVANAAKNIATPGSAFWNNPLTKQIAAGVLASEVGNTASELATGKGYMDNAAEGVEQLTGYNPNNNPLTSMVFNAMDPLYFTPYSKVKQGLEAVGNGVKEAVYNIADFSKVGRAGDAAKKYYSAFKKVNQSQKFLRNQEREFINPQQQRKAYKLQTWELKIPEGIHPQIKPLIQGAEIEKGLSKQGTISRNQLEAYIKKQGNYYQELMSDVLNTDFSGQAKIDYNAYREAVQRRLPEYSRVPHTEFQDYGLDRLGFNSTDKLLRENDYRDLEKKLLEKHPEEYYFEPNWGPLGMVVNKETGRRVTPDELAHRLVGELPQLNTFTFESPGIRGNIKHFLGEPLGHSRTYTTKAEPDVLHVMESQSDWAQRLKLSDARVNLLKENIKNYEATLNELKERPNKSRETQLLIDNYSRSIKKMNEELAGPNPMQKHMAETFTERQLQENLKYAVEHGHTKMRYPTSDTAAKIEGYWKEMIPSEEYKALLKEFEKLLYENKGPINTWPIELQKKVYEYDKTLSYLKDSNIGFVEDYRPEHKTILKKYEDFPKQWKKLFKNSELRTVTDAKGNTWYEVDVPEGYRNNKAEIIFANGGYVSQQPKPNQHADGGPVNKFDDGGDVKHPMYNVSYSVYDEKTPNSYWDNYDWDAAMNTGASSDIRGHWPDKFKKDIHPTSPKAGTFVNDNKQFELSDWTMYQSPRGVNNTLFGIYENGDGNVIPTYKGSVVLPEYTVTPDGGYTHDTYDNVKLYPLDNKYAKGGQVSKNHKKLLPELSAIEYKSKDDNEYANKLYRLQTIKNLYDNDQLTDDEYLQMVDDNLKSADGYKNAGKIGSYIQGYTGDESVSDYINNQLRKSSIGNMIADGRWTKDWEYNMLGR